MGSCLLQQQTKLSAIKPTKISLEHTSAGERLSSAVEHLQSVRCSHDDKDDTPQLLATSVVNSSSLDTALELGAKFLMSRQKPEGNFHYEYDWKKKENSDDDNSVRQAGTTWGLAFLHAGAPSAELSEAVLKALKFFEQYASEDKHGRRFVRYPGEEDGKLGTIALLALAHIDFLRSSPMLDAKTAKKLKNHLDGYIKFLLHAETSVGKGDNKRHAFHGRYKHSGEPFADDSAYFDGEALLALVRAARHMGHKNLWETIPRVAKGSWLINAETGLDQGDKHGDKHGDGIDEKELKRMKGFYQWSSMAMYELLQTDKHKFTPFEKRILRYADWRLGSAKFPLDQKKNAAVTLEGLVPAYLVALGAQDKERADKIGCLLRRSGIPNLNIMQVGHPDAQGEALKASNNDPHAFGGVQPSVDSPKLRIDTTQHQMHAVLQIKQMLTSHGDALLF